MRRWLVLAALLLAVAGCADIRGSSAPPAAADNRSGGGGGSGGDRDRGYMGY